MNRAADYEEVWRFDRPGATVTQLLSMRDCVTLFDE